MSGINPCEEVRHFLIYHLERDIEAHERGDFYLVGQWEKLLPSYSNCSGGDEEEESCLAVAYNFWDRWIDARNHEWGYYPGVEPEDWPVIARHIVQGLREGWNPDKMWDNPVLNPPTPETRLF